MKTSLSLTSAFFIILSSVAAGAQNNSNVARVQHALQVKLRTFTCSRNPGDCRVGVGICDQRGDPMFYSWVKPISPVRQPCIGIQASTEELPKLQEILGASPDSPHKINIQGIWVHLVDDEAGG